MRDRICIHYYVSGKVQGVSFRAATKEQAEQLGITGWACNLPDGQVEVLACGEKEKVHQLSDWLKQGPRLATVTHLSAEELPWQDHQGFNIL
jgi:acylphosphatase